MREREVSNVDQSILFISIVQYFFYIFIFLSISLLRQVHVLTYSPDGAWLAAGSQDYNIYIYDTDDAYSLRHVLKRHNSHVSCLDFTEDSKYIRSTCGGNELLFWDARKGKPMPGGATTLRDAMWHTTTCPLVWSTQGVLEDDPKSLCVSRNEKNNLIVLGDSKGMLSLLNFPCPSTPWCRAEFSGHGSYISCVRFTKKDMYVVSLGGTDHSVFQWRVTRDDDHVEEKVKEVTKKVEMENEADTPYVLEHVGQGDEFLALKPWLGAIKAPTKSPVLRKTCPSSYLELSFVHGSSARPRSVKYLRKRKVFAYTVAAMVVLHDLSSNSQSYFRGYHTGQIRSMAISNDERICASGGSGQKPCVYVWCTKTFRVITRLAGHRRSVDALAFSPNGRYLVSVGGETNRLLFLYERNEKSFEIVVSKQRIGNDKITDVHVDNDGNCVTVGARHACRWKLQNKRFKRRKMLAKHIANLHQILTCTASYKNICVVGATNGDVYIFKDRTAILKIIAHNGAVRVVQFEKDQMSFLTAGADGFVKRFSLQDDLKIQDESVLTEISKKDIVCLSRDETNSLILLTSQAEVYQCSQIDGSQSCILINNHGSEMRDVATSPCVEICATCGDDGTVRTWDLQRHQNIHSVRVGERAVAVTFDSSGDRIVAACVSSSSSSSSSQELVELESSTLKETRRVKMNAKKPCHVVRFSPDGRWLALGSHDHNIYLHDGKNFECRHVLGKHNAIVLNLDWTSDSRYLHSTCAGHELLFWDAERGQHMPGGATTLRDASWASWTCALGWPVKGLDSTDEVCFVSANQDSKLLICGYVNGTVRLTRYPCPEKAGSVMKRGHDSIMCRADWIMQHDYDRKGMGLVTAGGRDASIIQWNVLKSGFEK